MKKLLIFLLLTASAIAQNTVTVTAANIHNGSSGLLTAGTVLFQPVNAAGQNISYQTGGTGPNLSAPTICSISNGAITGSCSLANVAVAIPQNFFFAVTVKNNANLVVLGGPGTGYQLQPVPNSNWCLNAVCNFDTFYPTIPNSVFVLFLPPPALNSLGGIYSGACPLGQVASGYDVTGHEVCVSGGSGGGGVWGTITGTLSNQTDLWTYLTNLAPLNGPSFTGVPTVPTPLLSDNSGTIPNTSWVQSQGYALLNSPAFFGTPTAPTPLTSDSSTKLATTAWVNAQGYGVASGNVSGPGSSINADIVIFNGTNGKVIQDAGFGFPLPAAHIGTLVAGSNGLANSATTDTTNASNIVSGTLASAQMPNPSSGALGGVKSYTAVSHQWLNSLSTTGSFTSAQPTCGDLSNAAPSCSADTTNASNITSGAINSALLSNPIFPTSGLLLANGTGALPSVAFGSATGLGFYLTDVPGSWNVTASSGTGTVETLTVSNTSNWPFSFVVGEYVDVEGNGAYNCFPCQLTAVSSGSGTISYAGTATAPTSGGTVNFVTISASSGLHKLMFNSLHSTSANASQSGSIQLGPTDGLTAWTNVSGGYTSTLIQKNVNSSAGDVRAAQIGDPTYGALTAVGAPLVVNGPFTAASTATFNGAVTASAGITGNISTATALAAYTNYSVYGSGNGVGAFITPTANGQCLLSDAASFATVTPSFRTCVATVPVSSLANATVANTTANGAFQQTMNFALTSSTGLGLAIGESSASTGGVAGTQGLLSASTLSGSTATPLILNQGSITGSTPYPVAFLSSTYNNAALAGNMMQFVLTDTASLSGSTFVSFTGGTLGTVLEADIDKGGVFHTLNGVQALTATQGIQICGGLCGVTNAGQVGGIIAGGSNNASNGASAKAGYSLLVGGGLTNATPNATALEGPEQVASNFLKGTGVAAVGDVVCGTTTAYTVTDCTAGQLNVVGIAQSTTNPIGVVHYGKALVKFDGAVTLGDIACGPPTSTGTTGQAHDNGTSACPSTSSYIGVIVADSGTLLSFSSGNSTASTAMSTTLAEVQLHLVP